MYIGDTLARRAIYSPDRLAVVDAGKAPRPHYTYAQLNERANRFANWLRDVAGITKGDRVGIVAFDGVEFLDAFFACGKLGAILACYNWRMHWRELAQVIADTTPKLLIFSDEFRDKVEALLPESPSVTHTLHIEGEGVAGSQRFEDALQSGDPAPVVDESITEEDIVALIFTGGTTGLPKGAQISHRMIGWNTLNTVIHDILPGDTTVNVFPMFHTGGLLVYTAPLMIVGGTVILVGLSSTLFQLAVWGSVWMVTRHTDSAIRRTAFGAGAAASLIASLLVLAATVSPAWAVTTYVLTALVTIAVVALLTARNRGAEG